MKIFSLNKAEYTTVGAFLTIILLLSLFWPTMHTVGIIPLFLHTLFFGMIIGQLLLPEESVGQHIFFGTLFYIGLLTILLSVIYWFFSFSILYVFSVTAILSILCLIVSYKKIHHITITLQNIQISFLHAILLFGNTLLVSRLFLRRTGDTLISPWTIFGPKFFILFFSYLHFSFFSAQRKSMHQSIYFSLFFTHSFPYPFC